MNKLVGTLTLLAVGAVVLAEAAPAIVRIAGALVPLILVVGIVVAVLRLVGYFTRE
jgi:hypothetical protein